MFLQLTHSILTTVGFALLLDDYYEGRRRPGTCCTRVETKILTRLGEKKKKWVVDP